MKKHLLFCFLEHTSNTYFVFRKHRQERYLQLRNKVFGKQRSNSLPKKLQAYLLLKSPPKPRINSLGLVRKELMASPDILTEC